MAAHHRHHVARLGLAFRATAVQEVRQGVVDGVVVKALGQGLEHRQGCVVATVAVEVGVDLLVQAIGPARGVAALVALHQLFGGVECGPIAVVGQLGQAREDQSAGVQRVTGGRVFEGTAEKDGAEQRLAQERGGFLAQVEALHDRFGEAAGRRHLLETFDGVDFTVFHARRIL